MTDTARRRRSDRRIEIVNGTAERLPFADDEFDLVVSTTSFDHWHDQAGGLRECARVLGPGGVLVIADLFSPLLVPTLIGTRRHKARTRARAERLIADAGLRPDGKRAPSPSGLAADGRGRVPMGRQLRAGRVYLAFELQSACARRAAGLKDGGDVPSRRPPGGLPPVQAGGGALYLRPPDRVEGRPRLARVVGLRQVDGMAPVRLGV